MSGRAQPLFGAGALVEWIRAGGHPARGPLGLSALLRWHAYWFERNWSTTLRRLAAAVLPRDPVFIVGPWRSGTTVLHELLAECGSWTTPRTWQCFSPSTCFLSGPPARESVVGRPMDEGRIATHGPQEEEFALLLLGEPSVYRGFIDPRRLRECGERLWSGGEGPLLRWQDFLRGISSTAPGAHRLLLKSPTHTFRLPLLRSLFPDARFIWIGRHVGDMLASNLRMWRAMMSTYALWECPPGTLEGFLRDATRACTSVLRRCLDEMPPERMLWVDFEALHDDPAAVLRRILRFAGAGSAGTVESAVSRVPVHRGARAAMPDDADATELDRIMRAARQRFGDRAAG